MDRCKVRASFFEGRLSLLSASACFRRSGRKQLLPQQRRGATAAEWSALTWPHCGSRLLEHIAENSRRKRPHCRVSRQCERLSKEPRLGALYFAPLTALCSCGSDHKAEEMWELYVAFVGRGLYQCTSRRARAFSPGWFGSPEKQWDEVFFFSFPRPLKGNFLPGVECAQLALRTCWLL